MNYTFVKISFITNIHNKYKGHKLGKIIFHLKNEEILSQHLNNSVMINTSASSNN